jgi:hypothetical protein
MHLFVTQFDRLVTDRVADEGREDHTTKQVRLKFVLLALAGLLNSNSVE